MSSKHLGCAALLMMSLALASCGGGGGSGDGGDTGTSDASTGNGSTGGSDGGTGGSDGGTTGQDGSTFFNDGSGISFANGLGATISRLFSVGFGGAGGPASRVDSAEGLQSFINRARTSETIDCDSGSVTSYSDTDDATGQPTGGGVEYNDCVLDGISASGSISFSGVVSDENGNGTLTMTFNNFTSNDNGEVASINGTITIAISGDNDVQSFTVSGPSLDLVDSQGAISFVNYSMTISTSTATGEQSLSATASITDESGTIQLDIDPAFVIGGEYLYPITGQLSMTHSDGSSLTINADSGNPETFTYTVSDGSSVNSGEQRWDETDLVVDE